jgi:hypothetical protein
VKNYYFRMKVGVGNSLFFPSVASSFVRNGGIFTNKDDFEEVTKDLEKYLMSNPVIDLFVGYSSDQGVLKLEDNNLMTVQPIVGTYNEADFLYNYRRKDFYYFGYASKNKDSCRIIIFTDKHLIITKPTGIWDKIDTSNLFKSFEPYPLITRLQDLGADTGKKTTSVQRWNMIHGNAMFQVEVMQVVNRDELLPSLDSLAVYQFLSQGTLRPFFAIGKSRQEEIKSIMEYKRIERNLLKRIEFADSKAKGVVAEVSEDGKEHLFGYFYRLILDQTVDSKVPHYISPDLKAKMPYILISPVQLEAAAAIFLRDIGFMPDFYVANSKDYIDVRGREIIQKRRTPSQGALIQSLGLENYKKVITVQCKDYENSENSDADILLQPLPDNKKNNGKSRILSLKSILEAMDAICPLNKGIPKQAEEIFDLQIWWNNHARFIEELNFRIVPDIDNQALRNKIKEEMVKEGIGSYTIPDWAIEEAIDIIITDRHYGGLNSWARHPFSYKYELKQFQSIDLLRKYHDALKDNSHYWGYKKYVISEEQLILGLNVKFTSTDPFS